jgi:TfoX/Sxy family transcriptional regulator of competence genes
MRGYRERSLFGGWGFIEGKSVFAVAWDRGFVVKMAPDEYLGALKMPGVVPFSPMGENSMTTWVVVNDEATADDNDLLEWVERALRGVRSVPLKRMKAKRPAKRAPKPAARKASVKRGATPTRSKGATKARRRPKR